MPQVRHPMLVEETHDDLARENFVQALKAHVAQRVTPGVPELYEARARRRWEAATGAAPADRHEVRSALADEPYYRLWSSVRRASQHLLWASVAESVVREADQLVAKAKAVERGLGSLRLDPDLEIPWYGAEVDIHAMPGGYRGEYRDDDVAVGALYDRGVYVYAMGQMGDLNDDYGQSIVANHLAAQHPDFIPERILDIGLHGRPRHPALRRRVPRGRGPRHRPWRPGTPLRPRQAEALGRAVHFSQQNAEATDFPDGHFDLIVSHIVLHELSPAAIRNTLAECRRLLRPGGLMIHADFPGYAGVDPLTQAMIDWDTYNNHEPFWGPMRDMDLTAEAVAAGFDGADVDEVIVPTGRVLQTGERSATGRLWLLVGEVPPASPGRETDDQTPDERRRP